MRCKACNSVLKDNEILFRTITTDEGDKRVMEDLCLMCRCEARIAVEDDEDVLIPAGYMEVEDG
jgi:hypothetical protein